MANDNKEIAEIVKKCKILLLDIEGTTTSISFVKDKLFPYAVENVKQFLDSQWETDDVKEVVAALRKLALEDQEKGVDGAVAIPGENASKEDQIEGLVNNVKWQMSSDRKESALKQLQGLIWKQGYDSGDIKGHVYDDVSAALEHWHSVDGQKVYIYSSGSVQAQKLLFGQSLAGDLLRFIDGHFDTAVGAKQEASSYTTIAEKIGVQPGNMLFLTDIPKEGEAARTAGYHVALVSREGNAPLPSEATEAFAVLHTFAQLTASNKRKTEPQDEQPAKVAKTDADDDVKMASESVVTSEKKTESVVKDGQEKMEVEETPSIEVISEKENKGNKTVIEDVTATMETSDVPMTDVESLVTEVQVDNSDTRKNTEEINTATTEALKSVEVVTKLDNVAINSEGPVMSDEVEGQSKDEIIIKSGEGTKLNELITKSDAVVPATDINETKSEDILKDTEASLSNETKGVLEAIPMENESKMSEDGVKEESVPLKEQIETQMVKEKAKEAEETPPAVITEIEEITSENLGDVADIIDDLEPIVEEPPNEDMEDLKNVGEVLEKECDEILSKVQDVTNLDSIPLKPLLNTIVEETMETEIDADNMDSNDIVDRILDTELELEMKQCNDIDLNTVTEIADDTKIDESVETKSSAENQNDLKSNPKVDEKAAENKKDTMDMETNKVEPSSDDNMKNDDQKENKKKENTDIVESKDNVDKNDIQCSEKVVSKDDVICNKEVEIKEKLDTESNIGEEQIKTIDKDDRKDLIDKIDQLEKTKKNESNNKVEETQVLNSEDSKIQHSENNTDDLKTQSVSSDIEMLSEGTMNSEKDKESQVNGKATNGDTDTVNVNGDASNVELNSRLSIENGKDAVNGSNGDSVLSEKGKGDNVEAEMSDIKVKTVATEEPHTDPIEQPTEA